MKKKDTKEIKKTKLKISDIKKYNSINIEHTLDKIKAHEKEATIITVCIMILIISLLCLIFFTSLARSESFLILSSVFFPQRKIFPLWDTSDSICSLTVSPSELLKHTQTTISVWDLRTSEDLFRSLTS